ncbi:uncharacterized protein LOC124264641 [Haliotis rubra]|uniref:uncharacterized protein LOC124264641 n=1 Tax=Haliotis rubra TaxID=36100 RepID=UPI001EE5D281|nr:uncharacterized protein LOC124264641 [Haliotis rubra]
MVLRVCRLTGGWSCERISDPFGDRVNTLKMYAIKPDGQIMEKIGVFILILFLRVSKERIQANPGCENIKYSHVMTFDNRLFSRWLFWTKPSVNRNECATFCLQEKACVAFQVNSGGSVCRGYAVAFNENSESESAPGYMLYVSEKAQGFIGSSCQNNTDCYLASSVCVNSECMCDPGLAFSPQQKACVSTCTEYGPHYTTIRGYYIGNNNMATYTGVTEQQCMDHCTNHVAFVCRTADRRASDGRCDLTTHTLLTVAASDYTIVTDRTIMSQFSRDCKA